MVDGIDFFIDKIIDVAILILYYPIRLFQMIPDFVIYGMIGLMFLLALWIGYYLYHNRMNVHKVY